MNVQGVIQGDTAPQPVVLFAGLLNPLDIPDDVLRQGVGFDNLQVVLLSVKFSSHINIVWVLCPLSWLIIFPHLKQIRQ